MLRTERGLHGADAMQRRLASRVPPCEYAHNRMSSGRLAALGDNAPLVTPHINIQSEGGGKSLLLINTGNATGLAVSKVLLWRNLPHVQLERLDSRLIDTAGASPLVLENRRGHVRFRAQVFE